MLYYKIAACSILFNITLYALICLLYWNIFYCILLYFIPFYSVLVHIIFIIFLKYIVCLLYDMYYVVLYCIIAIYCSIIELFIIFLFAYFLLYHKRFYYPLVYCILWYYMFIWLVFLEHFLFSIYWEFHNPNWRSHIFRGVGKPPTGYMFILYYRPSGKYTKNMENHHFQWVNQLFRLGIFYIANCLFTGGYMYPTIVRIATF